MVSRISRLEVKRGGGGADDDDESLSIFESRPMHTCEGKIQGLP